MDENNNKGKFLLDYNAITFGKTIIDGFPAPYCIRLPRPTPIEFLKTIGDEASNCKIFNLGHTHILGIPNSGIPISTAIGLSIYEKNPNVLLSIFDSEKFDGEITGLDKKTPLVLIDNSIKSGKTIYETLSKLQELGCNVNYILTLFNREETRTEFLFKSEFPNIPIVYLYSILDIIKYLDGDRKRTIINHLKEHGTKRAIKFIKHL